MHKTVTDKQEKHKYVKQTNEIPKMGQQTKPKAEMSKAPSSTDKKVKKTIINYVHNSMHLRKVQAIEGNGAQKLDIDHDIMGKSLGEVQNRNQESLQNLNNSDINNNDGKNNSGIVYNTGKTHNSDHAIKQDNDDMILRERTIESTETHSSIVKHTSKVINKQNTLILDKNKYDTKHALQEKLTTIVANTSKIMSQKSANLEQGKITNVFHENTLQNCLKRKKIYILGDSHARFMFFYLLKSFGVLRENSNAKFKSVSKTFYIFASYFCIKY